MKAHDEASQEIFLHLFNQEKNMNTKIKTIREKNAAATKYSFPIDSRTMSTKTKKMTRKDLGLLQ